jgi:hypothetical protein
MNLLKPKIILIPLLLRVRGAWRRARFAIWKAT